MQIEYYLPGQIRYTRSQIVWLLGHIHELREGRWPANPAETGYRDAMVEEVKPGKRGIHTKTKRSPRARAYFETPLQVVAELDYRLNSCHLDGLITECAYAYEMNLHDIARYCGCDEVEAQRRIGKALRYCSGKSRRDLSYDDWKNHRGVE